MEHYSLGFFRERVLKLQRIIYNASKDGKGGERFVGFNIYLLTLMKLNALLFVV